MNDKVKEEVKYTVYRDQIAGFHGSWGSGLASLTFESGRSVMCENGQTVRALDACFGDVITEGHCVDQQAIIGKDIVWSMDDLGILEGFTPACEWRGELPELGGEIEITLTEEDESDE